MQIWSLTFRICSRVLGVKCSFFYQYVQSFSPKEEVTPEEAHQIAQELAERFFPGCEVLVATHMDT